MQNADDLAYESGVCPELRIETLPDGLLVSNNERYGFSAADIRALCSVGQSTKKGTDESTGRKGIGFKSVFGLTKRPEIWSGEFQIRFDSTQLGGEIIPEWVEEAPVAFPTDMTTLLWLPMRNSNDAVGRLLEGFKSESLLFLRRIRAVRVVTASEMRLYSMQESILDGTIKCREVGVSDDKSLLFSRKFFVIEEDTYDESLVKLAFPDPAWFKKCDAKERSFAIATYLPVVDVGFPFVIQADFLLTANRENVHQDDEKNLALRTRISPLFAVAIQRIASLQKNLSLYVPAVTSISAGWWTEVVHSLRRVVQSVVKVKCFDKKLRPAEVCIVASDSFEAVLGSDLIVSSLGLYPVHSTHRKEAISLFGCKQMERDEFLTCLKLCQFSRLSASWFDDLYRILEQFSLSLDHLKMFLKLPLFCDASAKAFAIEDAMPMISPSDELVDRFGCSVPFLHPKSFKSTQAKSFLARLGFGKPATDSEISDAVFKFHMAIQGRELRAEDALWMQHHVEWLSQCRVVDRAKIASAVICLPAFNLLHNADELKALCVHEVFLDRNDVPKTLAVLVEESPIWVFASPPKCNAKCTAYLERLGVLRYPPLVKQSESTWKAGPILAEILENTSLATVEPVLELLFRQWPYYRQSTDVILRLQALGAPVSNSSEELLPWNRVFLAKSTEQSDSPMCKAVPVLALPVSFIQSIPHWPIIVQDLELKQFPLEAHSQSTVAMLLVRSHCQDVKVWESFYLHCHRNGLPAQDEVFVPASYRRDHCLEEFWDLPDLLPITLFLMTQLCIHCGLMVAVVSNSFFIGHQCICRTF